MALQTTRGIRRAFKIFDLFTTKRPGRGTGLGLSICLAILREHNGQIESQPLADGGTVFTVSLPVAKGTELFLAEPPVSRADAAPSGSLAGCSVLVVDDEESIREMVRDGLAARACVWSSPLPAKKPLPDGNPQLRCRAVRRQFARQRAPAFLAGNFMSGSPPERPNPQRPETNVRVYGRRPGRTHGARRINAPKYARCRSPSLSPSSAPFCRKCWPRACWRFAQPQTPNLAECHLLTRVWAAPPAGRPCSFQAAALPALAPRPPQNPIHTGSGPRPSSPPAHTRRE